MLTSYFSLTLAGFVTWQHLLFLHSHPRLTLAIAAVYIEAASICLAKHHQSPATFTLNDHNIQSSAAIHWDDPNSSVQLAWANEVDATEAGACGCAISALALSRNLYALRRAETLTGADYYIAPLDSDPEDLENG